MNIRTNMSKTTHYEIRSIDPNGDVIDIEMSRFGSGSGAAIKRDWYSMEPGDDVAAFVLERVTVVGCDSEGVQDMDYQTIATKGDPVALDLFDGGGA